MGCCKSRPREAVPQRHRMISELEGIALEPDYTIVIACQHGLANARSYTRSVFDVIKQLHPVGEEAINMYISADSGCRRYVYSTVINDAKTVFVGRSCGKFFLDDFPTKNTSVIRIRGNMRLEHEDFMLESNGRRVFDLVDTSDEAYRLRHIDDCISLPSCAGLAHTLRVIEERIFHR